MFGQRTLWVARTFLAIVFAVSALVAPAATQAAPSNIVAANINPNELGCVRVSGVFVWDGAWVVKYHLPYTSEELHWDTGLPGEQTIDVWPEMVPAEYHRLEWQVRAAPRGQDMVVLALPEVQVERREQDANGEIPICPGELAVGAGVRYQWPYGQTWTVHGPEGGRGCFVNVSVLPAMVLDGANAPYDEEREGLPECDRPPGIPAWVTADGGIIRNLGTAEEMEIPAEERGFTPPADPPKEPFTPPQDTTSATPATCWEDIGLLGTELTQEFHVPAGCALVAAGTRVRVDGTSYVDHVVVRHGQWSGAVFVRGGFIVVMPEEMARRVYHGECPYHASCDPW